MDYLVKGLIIVMLLCAWTTPASTEAIVEVGEKELLSEHLHYEVALIYDRDGNETNVFKGGAWGSKLTIQYTDDLRNHIITHNHPPGGLNSLSPADIFLATIYDADEIRAVSYSYVDSKPLLCRAWRIKNWPSLSLSKMNAEVLKEIRQVSGYIKQEAVLDNFNKRLAANYNFGYECKEF